MRERKNRVWLRQRRVISNVYVDSTLLALGSSGAGAGAGEDP
jgi:hypothetical protein